MEATLLIAKWLRAYVRTPLAIRLALAFVLGAAAGLAVGPRAIGLRPLGDLLLRLLQMLVLPIVVPTIVVGISTISARTLGRVGAKTIAWYAGTALAAAVTGVASAWALGVGVGLRLPDVGRSPQPTRPPLTWAGAIGGLVPDNVVAAMAHGQLLPVVVFAVLFALAVASPRDSDADRAARLVHQLFDAIARAAYKMLHWVMQYAPVGIFALAAVTFGQGDAGAFAEFVGVVGAVYLGQALACAGCAALLIPSGVRLVEFFRGVKEALVTAFVTGSSAATLPVEMEAAERRLHLDRAVFAFTLPLGVGVHKIGTAVHLGAVSVFAAHAAGLRPSLVGYGALTMLAFLASVATPPISGGAFLMLSFIFTQAGLPQATIALIAGIPFLGKFNTPVNSLGRLVGTTLVARSESAHAGAWSAAPEGYAAEAH